MQSLLRTFFGAILVCAAATAFAVQPDAHHVLFDFEDKKGQWVSVNDNVMGGVSRGGSQMTGDGKMVFSGALSLENNGGFSSVRAGLDAEVLAGHKGLIMRVKGDGRDYYVNLHTQSQVTPGSWRASLPTKKDTWQEMRVPFDSFEWTVFGRRLPSRKIDPKNMESLGLTIADKKEGPFRMEVDWIAAYGAGPKELDLIGRAAEMEKLNTFLTALDAAGLKEALRDSGPITVFAPTNAAFGKLPEETLTALLKPENRLKLTAVLLNHVAPGRLILGQRQVQTLKGSPVKVRTEGSFRLDEAKVLTPDVEASNGIVHVIDSVLVPAPAKLDTNEAALQVIDRAIAVGVPLYNAGNAAACTAVYEVAVDSLRDADAPGLSNDIQNTLRVAAGKTARENDPLQAAWILRQALDTTREALR